jgi:hypothetical protein
MKIKSNLVFLGFARRVQWLDFKGSRNVETWKKATSRPRVDDPKKAALLITADTKILYIVPWRRPRILNAPQGYDLHKKTFERWSNAKATEAINLYFPKSVRKLDHVGYIEEIEYTSDKFERPSDQGEYNLYVHVYQKPGPAIYVNCPMRPDVWGVSDKGRKLMSYRGLIL